MHLCTISLPLTKSKNRSMLRVFCSNLWVKMCLFPSKKRECYLVEELSILYGYNSEGKRTLIFNYFIFLESSMMFSIVKKLVFWTVYSTVIAEPAVSSPRQLGLCSKRYRSNKQNKLDKDRRFVQSLSRVPQNRVRKRKALVAENCCCRCWKYDQ